MAAGTKPRFLHSRTPQFAAAIVSLLLFQVASAPAREPEASPIPPQGAATASSIRALFLANHADAAGRQVKSLLETDPGNAGLQALLGDILFRQSRFSEAGVAYRRSVQADRNCARGYLGLGRLEILSSHKVAARQYMARAYQLDPRDPDIVLSFANFVDEPRARTVLLRNFMALSRGGADRARVEDAAARLEIVEQLGHLEAARLATPYRSYNFKLEGYFPDGRTRSGLLIKVALNGGKALRLILDTGADGIFVSSARARAANLERLTADRVAGVGPVVNTDSYVAMARHISIGTLELENGLVHVTDASSFPNADGAIGMNVFADFLVRVDPASLALDLIPFPASPAVSSPSPNTLPAFRADQLLLINAPADGQPDRYFLVDTGSSFSAESGTGGPGTAGEEVDIRGASGRLSGVRRAQPIRLIIAGRKLIDKNPVRIDLSELSRHVGIEISGIIGYPLLAHSVLTINYRDGLIQFDWPDR